LYWRDVLRSKKFPQGRAKRNTPLIKRKKGERVLGGYQEFLEKNAPTGKKNALRSVSRGESNDVQNHEKEWAFLKLLKGKRAAKSVGYQMELERKFSSFGRGEGLSGQLRVIISLKLLSARRTPKRIRFQNLLPGKILEN